MEYDFAEILICPQARELSLAVGESQNLFLRNLRKASDSYGLFIFPGSSVWFALQSHKSNFVYFAQKLPIFLDIIRG